MAGPADDLLDRVVGLVDHDNPEVRCAAALILGVLGIDTPSARKALTRAMKSENEVLRRYALDGLTRLGVTEKQLDAVVPMLAGSPELARQAAETLRSAGTGGIPRLVETIREKAPLRSAAIDTLAGMADAGAVDALYDLAADRDAAVARPVIEALARKAAASGSKDDHAERAVKLARRVPSGKAPDAGAALARLLGAVGGADAVRHLLSLAAKDSPGSVRTSALRALEEMEIPKSEADEVFKKLMPSLKEPNYEHAVRPALHVLRKLALSRKHFETVLGLMKNPHRSVRAYAVHTLGAMGGAAATRILFDGLQDAERKVQEAAATALSADPQYVSRLVAAFHDAKSPQEAWRIGALLSRQKDALDKRTIQSFVRSAIEALLKKQGHFQACFEIVRASSPELLREEFLKKGRDLLTRGKVDEAASVLRHLDREDLSTSDTDIALAAALATKAPREMSRRTGESDRALVLVSRAVRREDRNVLSELGKYKKTVGPDALLYLGFHLAEKPGMEREFAVELLRVIAKTWRGTAAAETAERKVRSEGRSAR